MSSNRYQPATADGLAISTWCSPERARGYLTNLASGSGTSINTYEYYVDGYKLTGTDAAFNTDHEKALATHPPRPIVVERQTADNELKRTHPNECDTLYAGGAAKWIRDQEWITVTTFPPRWAYAIARYYWDQPDD